MRRAIADIGSNTVKCAIFDYTEGDPFSLECVGFYTQTLGLIARVHSGVLDADALTELVAVLVDYKRRALKAGAQSFDVFATASLRSVNDPEPVNSTVERALGSRIDILSGGDEAALSFAGLMSERPDITCGLMADMGGGSTELVKFTNGTIVDSCSLPFGCVSLKRDYIAGHFPIEAEREKIRRHVLEQLADQTSSSPNRTLCLIGGTGKAVGKLFAHINGTVQRTDMSAEDFHMLIKRFSAPTKVSEELLAKLVPSRVETIIPGILGYSAICEAVRPEVVAVATAGVRDGYLIDRYVRKGS